MPEDRLLELKNGIRTSSVPEMFREVTKAALQKREYFLKAAEISIFSQKKNFHFSKIKEEIFTNKKVFMNKFTAKKVFQK